MGDVHSCCGLDFKVEKTKDINLIRSLIGNKDLINGFTSINDFDEYIKKLSVANTCYLLKCKDRIAGLAMILSLPDDIIKNNISIVDIGFFKSYRGKVALDLSKFAIDEFFNKEECEELIGIIDKANKASLYYALWLGFELYSQNDLRYYLRYRKDGKRNRWVR